MTLRDQMGDGWAKAVVVFLIVLLVGGGIWVTTLFLRQAAALDRQAAALEEQTLLAREEGQERDLILKAIREQGRERLLIIREIRREFREATQVDLRTHRRLARFLLRLARRAGIETGDVMFTPRAPRDSRSSDGSPNGNPGPGPGPGPPPPPPPPPPPECDGHINPQGNCVGEGKGRDES